MISNDELLKKFQYLRREVRGYQELKDRMGEIESAIPRIHHFEKQPLEEGNHLGRRDGRGYIITPRNLFASGDQITI